MAVTVCQGRGVTHQLSNMIIITAVLNKDIVGKYYLQKQYCYKGTLISYKDEIKILKLCLKEKNK